MSVLTITRLSHVPLSDVTCELAAGLHVVLAAPEDGSRAFLELASGLLRPRRGTVRIDGVDPLRSPALRRRIGSVFVNEEPSFSGSRPRGQSVQQWLGRRLAVRGQTVAAAEVLQRLGLEDLLAREVSGLVPGEQRALAWAVALSIEVPALLVVEEPFLGSGRLARSAIADELVGFAAQCPVLCTTASPAHAALLSTEVAILDGGRFQRVALGPTAPALTPGAGATLVVTCRDVAGLAVALALRGDLAVASVDSEQHRLLVHGQDLRAVGRHVLEACAHADFGFLDLRQALPELLEVRAATAGLSRGAFERARLAGGPPPSAFWAAAHGTSQR